MAFAAPQVSLNDLLIQYLGRRVPLVRTLANQGNGAIRLNRSP